MKLSFPVRIRITFKIKAMKKVIPVSLANVSWDSINSLRFETFLKFSADASPDKIDGTTKIKPSKRRRIDEFLIQSL